MVLKYVLLFKVLIDLFVAVVIAHTNLSLSVTVFNFFFSEIPSGLFYYQEAGFRFVYLYSQL